MRAIACSVRRTNAVQVVAENKTKPTRASVTEFINSIDDPQKRADARKVAAMMRKSTGKRAKMWGSSMVGFGQYHYRYASGREGNFFLTGFSPRKSALTVYIMPGFEGYRKQMEKLGPHKTGKSCLYLKNLASVDRNALEEIIRDSVSVMKKRYG